MTDDYHPSFDLRYHESFRDYKDGLCPVCQELDLDSALSSDNFANLPPYHSPEASWSHYIRPVRRYKLDDVVANQVLCTFCQFLSLLAVRIQKYPVPRATIHSAIDSSVTDGDGYVLASVPGNLVYAGDTSVGEEPDAGRSGVFLLVLKGDYVLERLADTLSRSRLSPKLVADQAVQHAKHRGTIISPPAEEAFQASPSVQYRKINPDRADYEQIKSWIGLCSKSHDKCNQRSGKAPVPRMKVIDCRSRKIVKPDPALPYAALSYVWGTDPPEKYVYPDLPDNMPHVIQDAILVALKLGIPYLWVDRFCIWQDDPTQSHKMGQINAMGQIYGDAIITIVAAAGHSPSYGLPGVGGGRSLNLQLVGQFRDKTLVADFSWDAQRLQLSRSRWRSRGWTYQEWVLSTRVLLFTEYRVSFQCLGMECIEQLNHPITIDDGWRKDTEHTLLYKPDGPSNFLSAFSKRRLTYDGDALHAISGILSAWAASNEGAGHIMGVPIVLPALDSGTAASLFTSFWAGLAWTLKSPASTKAGRRCGIPTWSCLSVKDGSLSIGYNSEMFTMLRNDPEFDGSVSLERSDGSVTSFEEFVTSGAFSTAACKDVPAIHLSGWCFKVGPFRKENRRIFLDLGPSYEGQQIAFIPDHGTGFQDSALQDEFEAISPYCLHDSRCAMVFERTDDKVSGKRIGILKLCSSENGETEKKRGPRQWNPVEIFGAHRETVRLV